VSAEHVKLPSGGWTVETLKAHFEQRFIDVDKAVNAALAAAKEAVAAALAAAEKAREQAADDNKAWRASANEWRGSMQDREVRFATRTEMDAKFDAVNVALRAIQKDLDRNNGQVQGGKGVKDESRANIALFVSIVAGMVGLVGLAVVLVRVFSGH
jgi:hypothetical protein